MDENSHVASRYVRSPSTSRSAGNSRRSASSMKRTASSTKSTESSTRSTVSLTKSTASSNMETMVSSAKVMEVLMEATASGIIAEPTTPPRHSGNEAIIAYVHQLSPIKRNKKNTIHYSTLLLQMKDESAQEALLYSKHKRPLLMDSEKCRTPVKIQRFTFNSDGKKIIINDIGTWTNGVLISVQREFAVKYATRVNLRHNKSFE